MKLFGRFLLWLVLLALLAIVSWGVTLYADWPLWAAAAIFLGVLGAWFLLKFLRRLFLVLRSRSKMAQLSRADRQKALQIAPEAVLTRKWKAAVATLRNSSLRRFGNPLYVLPWYMVIGKSGSGKTTALTRARLVSPIQKVDQNAKVEQTANCDWWYFNQAIVIDCAGRYVGAEDIEQDRREWEVGLDLLAKYRAREGLNGLVLAVSAERLLNPQQDELIEEGRVIRERIEQLIRLFGKRFPIYVLVTKCDRLYGLEDWTARLPGSALNQAMGYLAGERDGAGGDAVFLEQAFGSIGERLRSLRLALAAQNPDAGPELLLFPNELEQLRSPLQAFLNHCLGENPYLESPFLRGLFFSSGQQEGGAVSRVLPEILPPVAAHPGTHAGLFLHDFFARILPRDRHIGRPAALRNRWRSTTRNLGLAAWALLAVALGIWMTVAFFQNLETLRLVQEHAPQRAAFNGDLQHDAALLEDRNQLLIEVDRRNRRWSARWLASLTGVGALENRLKQEYVDDFQRQLLPNADGGDPAASSGSDPSELPAQLRNQVRYINQLRARLQGADRDALGRLPQPETPNPERITSEQYARLNRLRLSSLAWSDAAPGSALADSLPEQQRRLERAAYREPPLSWLAGLAALEPGSKPVTLGEFWGGSAGERAAAGGPSVAPGFTAAGRAAIDRFLQELERSVDDPEQFRTHRAEFESWYRQQRLLAWQQFAAAFPEGERRLAGEAEWRAAMGTITGAHSPYYRLIDRLNQEFDGQPAAEMPEWLQLAREFSRLRGQAAKAGVAEGAIKYVGAINSVGGKVLRETLGGARQDAGGMLKNNLSAVDTLRKFTTELNQAATEAVDGPAKAYQLAADFHGFSNDPAIKQSLLISATETLGQLRRLLGHASPADEAVWRLIGGPLHFVLAYTEQQASCALQKDWEAKVHWPLQTATSMTAIVDQLYGSQGTVWAFADGPAKPFLERDASQFRVVQTRGYSLPFNSLFLPMLNEAVGKRVEQIVTQQRTEQQKQNEQLQAQKDQLQAQQAQIEAERALEDIKQKSAALKAQPLPLTITAQPTSVNPGASAKPFATLLTIQCAAGTRTLSNYNFPVSDSFAWIPGQCGEVNLEIRIDNLTLTKKYPGVFGVVRFVRDFRDGMRQFNADEFPASRLKLKELNVRQIGVRYDFTGQDAILKTAQQLEQLEQQEKETLAGKRRAQDQQAQQARQNIEVKLAGSPEPPMRVKLPEQIGVCWNPNSVPHKTQTLQAMFKELLEGGGNAAAPAAAAAAPLPVAERPGQQAQ